VINYSRKQLKEEGFILAHSFRASGAICGETECNGEEHARTCGSPHGRQEAERQEKGLGTRYILERHPL
jgi:hypothetical protein